MHPLAVARHELREAGLVDRDLAALRRSILSASMSTQHDLGAELREAGRGDEADVAGADHADRFALLAHEAGEVSGVTTSRTRVAATSAAATSRCRASALFVSVRDSVLETQ